MVASARMRSSQEVSWRQAYIGFFEGAKFSRLGTGGFSSLELGASPGIGGILNLAIGGFSSSGIGRLLSSGTGVFSQACSKLRLPS